MITQYILLTLAIALSLNLYGCSKITESVQEKLEKAQIERTKADILALENSLNLYRLNTGTYPTTQEGLAALISKKTLKTIPLDPWDNSYQYRNPGQHDDIDIYSYGIDGKEGGEGNNADIGNWNITK